jgi:hypothetical protein
MFRILLIITLLGTGVAVGPVLCGQQLWYGWSTYLGGSGDDRINVVKIAPDGDVLVGGNTTSTVLAGLQATLLGADDPARNSMLGGFVAKISPDGQTIRWIRRFGRGVFFLTDVATDGQHLYITGVATALAQPDLIEPFEGYDKSPPLAITSEDTGALVTHPAPNTYRSILLQLTADGSALANATWMGEPTPGREAYGIGDFIGSWYVSSDIWRYLKQREAWFFSGMNPYTINRIEVLANGDLIGLMDGGLRWAGGQDSLYRFAAGDLSGEGLLWKTVFDAAGNNSTLSTPVHSSVLSADLALAPDESVFYVTGGSNGWTGFEPYWNPFIFKFDTATGMQLWARDGVDKGGPFGALNIIQTMVRPNQADSFGQAVTVNSAGEPLLGMWSDGGNTYLTIDPWTLIGEPGTAANQDGDGFWGFKGRTFASVLGRYNPDGFSGWKRSHRIKPNPNTDPDQNATMFLSVAAAHDDPQAIIAAGWTFGMAEVNPWDASTGKGTLAKVRLADSGSTRLFVDRVSGVHEFMSVVADPAGNRYFAGGYAGRDAPIASALQPNHAGGNDGYLMLFAEQRVIFGDIAEKVTLERAGESMQIRFRAKLVATYQLESSTNLSTSDTWMPMDGIEETTVVEGQQITFSFPPEPSASGPVFYRIKATLD